MSSIALAAPATMAIRAARPLVSKPEPAAQTIRYRKRISAQEARRRLDQMHPKERARLDAFIRTGSVSDAARELAENRRTITASYKRYRHLLSDLFADDAGAIVPNDLD